MPLADLTFNLIMFSVAQELWEALKEGGFCTNLHLRPNAAPEPFHPVCWIDDVFVAIDDQDPGVLFEKLPHVVRLCVDIFESYGLKLNMSRAKTEAISPPCWPKGKEQNRSSLASPE